MAILKLIFWSVLHFNCSLMILLSFLLNFDGINFILINSLCKLILIEQFKFWTKIYILFEEIIIISKGITLFLPKVKNSPLSSWLRFYSISHSG